MPEKSKNYVNEVIGEDGRVEWSSDPSRIGRQIIERSFLTGKVKSRECPMHLGADCPDPARCASLHGGEGAKPGKNGRIHY